MEEKIIFKEEEKYLDTVKLSTEDNIKHYEKQIVEIPKKYRNTYQGDQFLVEVY